MKAIYSRSTKGASLIELMAAMGILTVILVMLSVALDASLGQFRSTTDRTISRTSGRVALQWIEQDLGSAFLPRPASTPNLPATLTPEQERYFEGRRFLPFELNRTESSDSLSSLPNAAPEFARLCFVTDLREQIIVDPDKTADTGRFTSASIVGYYVAFTRNSPLQGDSVASMKLFRHVRPSSSFSGGRYAEGFLLHNHFEINDSPDPGRTLSQENPAAIPRGSFANGDLPTLIGFRSNSSDPSSTEEGSPAWPVWPLTEYLAEAPADLNPFRGTDTAWQTAGSSVHDTIFPDEPVGTNVVRFELAAEKRIETSPGVFTTMSAAELNTHLGLGSGDEWPCLVVPDTVKITIATVAEGTARTLTRYEDWIVDWKKTDPTQWPPHRQRIEKGLQTFEIRVRIGRGTT